MNIYLWIRINMCHHHHHPCNCDSYYHHRCQHCCVRNNEISRIKRHENCKSDIDRGLKLLDNLDRMAEKVLNGEKVDFDKELGKDFNPMKLLQYGLARYEQTGTDEKGAPIYGIVPNLEREKKKEYKSTGISVDGSATYTVPLSNKTITCSTGYINDPITWTSPIPFPKITPKEKEASLLSMLGFPKHLQRRKEYEDTMKDMDIDTLEKASEVATDKLYELGDYIFAIKTVLNKKRKKDG